MRLIFVNRFYWPETPATAQLLTDLAEGLAARGHDVTIITSAPAGKTNLRCETHRGVRIQRVRGTRWARVGLLGHYTSSDSELSLTWRGIPVWQAVDLILNELRCCNTRHFSRASVARLRRV